MIGIIGLLITVGTLITTMDDVSEVIDPYVFTEAEAATAHDLMAANADEKQQTQAGFNAYTLRQLLQQEVEILVLRIRTETDPEKIEELRSRLKAKRDFMQRLEDEEREQLLKGEKV